MPENGGQAASSAGSAPHASPISRAEIILAALTAASPWLAVAVSSTLRSPGVKLCGGRSYTSAPQTAIYRRGIMLRGS